MPGLPSYPDGVAPPGRRGAADPSMPVIVLLVVLVVGLVIAGITLAFESFEVLETSPLPTTPDGAVHRIRVLDHWVVFIEPAYRLTRAAVSAFYLTGLAFISAAFASALTVAQPGERQLARRFFMVLAPAGMVLALDEFFALRKTLQHNLDWLRVPTPGGGTANAILLAYILAAVVFAWFFRDPLFGSRWARRLIAGAAGAAVVAALTRSAPVASAPVTVLAWSLLVAAIWRIGVEQAAPPPARPEKPKGRKRRSPAIGLRRWGAPLPPSSTRHSPWR